MAFENLRDQLKEQWADLSAKFHENPSINNLREKFESQTPVVQRAIIVGTCIFCALILLSLPYGYWSSSSDYMSQFDENRDLIQGLLKVSRIAKTTSPLPPPMDTNTLRARVDTILKSNQILQDQIGEFQDIPRPAVPSKMVPAIVQQNGVAFQVKTITVNQLIQLSNAIQNMGPGIKLMGLDLVQSANQTHYYDVIFKLVHFGLSNEVAQAPNRPTRGNDK